MSNFYLHYWFSDYAKKNGKMGTSSNNVYATFNATKNRNKYFGSGGDHLKNFKNRKANMVSSFSEQNIDDFETLLEFFTNPVLDKTRHDTFSSNVVQNWGVSKTQQATYTPEELANSISSFLSEFYIRLVEMAEKLNVSLGDFSKEVINSYAQKRGVRIGSKRFSKMVISDFIHHKGIVSLNLDGSAGTGSTNIESCLKAMVLLAEALPDFGVGGRQELGSMKYSTGSSRGEKISGSGSATLGIIAGKLQGLWSNVVGAGAEIAWQKAEETGLKKFDKKLEKIFSKISGQNYSGKNLNISVEVTGDKTTEKTKEIKSAAKSDVTITVSDNNVTVSYGVSVKQYKYNPKAGVSYIKLVSGTSFLKAAEKYTNAGKDRGYLLNLAGGHPNDIKGLYGGNAFSTANLNSLWDELVQSVVIMNFLDVIAGLGTTAMDNVLYLVSNGNVYAIDDILINLINNPDSIGSRIYKETKTKRGAGSKSLTRASLVKMNSWIYKKYRNRSLDRDTEKGKERSAAASSAIYSALEAQKLEVTLKDLEKLVS